MLVSRIISLDTSTINTGIIYIDSKTILVRFVERGSKPINEFANNVCTEMLSLYADEPGTVIFIEDVILGLNARSSIIQSRFIGMLEGILIGQYCGLNSWVFVHPSSVKKCFTGKGNSNKEVMIDRMMEIKGIKRILSKNSRIKNVKKQIEEYKSGKKTTLEHIADAFGVLSAGVSHNRDLVSDEVLEMMKKHNIPFE